MGYFVSVIPTCNTHTLYIIMAKSSAKRLAEVTDLEPVDCGGEVWFEDETPDEPVDFFGVSISFIGESAMNSAQSNQ